MYPLCGPLVGTRGFLFLPWPCDGLAVVTVEVTEVTTVVVDVPTWAEDEVGTTEATVDVPARSEDKVGTTLEATVDVQYKCSVTCTLHHLDQHLHYFSPVCTQQSWV